MPQQVHYKSTAHAIRPFVIGRKGWLFSDTISGALASANLYSLVETAKANGIEPHAYLAHLFAKLPYAKAVEDFEALSKDDQDLTGICR